MVDVAIPGNPKEGVRSRSPFKDKSSLISKIKKDSMKH